MNVKRYSFICFLVSLITAISFSEANEPPMFLCVDTIKSLKNRSGKENQKLVYGYINGKKTPCMSEYDLRVAYSQDLFKRDHDSGKASQKKQFQRDAVYRGEKNLAQADLRGFDLQGLDLSGANLQNALLESADLRGANLRNADLRGANLENAYCKNTNFFQANLSGIHLKGAFFHYANLQKTDGLTVENLSTVSTLYKALLEKPMLTIIESKYPSKIKNPKGAWKQRIYSENEDIPLSEQADPSKFH